ncbi:MAG: hypothetical protein ACMV1B_08980 [Prevotella sp.]
MKHEGNSYTITNGILAEELTKRFTERTIRIFDDADHLSLLADKLKNVIQDKAQGNLFEQLETMKFNYDALQKDSALFAKTTASMGFPTDPVDIIISDGKKIVREVQAKSCNSAARSAFSLSQHKYNEMLRLSPCEQHSKIEELLKKRIASGTLKADEYEQTLRNLVKTLQHDNIASSGTTYEEALNATDPSVAQKIADEFKLKSSLTDMHESGKYAGSLGAKITGGISILSESYALYNGEHELGEAVVNVISSSAKGYATGYTVTALSKGIQHTTSHFLGESIAKSLTRSNAPVAIAAGIVNAGKSMISYINGDIDSDQLLDEISHTAITSTSSFYYGALGQSLIPIPVVGAMIGAGVGYMIGNLLHQSGLLALGDSAVVKVSKERRRHVQAICSEAIPIIIKNRLELEASLDTYFSECKKDFDMGFAVMDKAMLDWEPDLFISGLNQINKRFDSVLPFNNFEEFDALMRSDEAFEF